MLPPWHEELEKTNTDIRKLSTFYLQFYLIPETPCISKLAIIITNISDTGVCYKFMCSVATFFAEILFVILFLAPFLLVSACVVVMVPCYIIIITCTCLFNGIDFI